MLLSDRLYPRFLAKPDPTIYYCFFGNDLLILNFNFNTQCLIHHLGDRLNKAVAASLSRGLEKKYP